MTAFLPLLNGILHAQSEESLRVLRSLGSECSKTHAAKVRDECSGWIGGPSFDGVSVNATTVAEN
jgi:hypothetical protein